MIIVFKFISLGFFLIFLLFIGAIISQGLYLVDKKKFSQEMELYKNRPFYISCPMFLYLCFAYRHDILIFGSLIFAIIFWILYLNGA